MGAQHLRTAAPASAGRVRRVAGSVVATAAVLLVFGALLSSADAAFSVVLDEVVPEINVGTVFRWIFLSVVGGLIAVAAVYTICRPAGPVHSGQAGHAPVRRRSSGHRRSAR